jgi:hypothetical protein
MRKQHEGKTFGHGDCLGWRDFFLGSDRVDELERITHT